MVLNVHDLHLWHMWLPINSLRSNLEWGVGLMGCIGICLLKISIPSIGDGLWKSESVSARGKKMCKKKFIIMVSAFES